jgi:hypothetical protein
MLLGAKSANCVLFSQNMNKRHKKSTQSQNILA